MSSQFPPRPWYGHGVPCSFIRAQHVFNDRPKRLPFNPNGDQQAGCGEERGRREPLVDLPLSIHFLESRAYPSDFSDYLFNLKCDKFLNSLQLSPSEIDSLQMQTVGQRENPDWMMARRKLLTASNFGQVVHLRDTTYRSGLVQKMIFPTPNSSSNAGAMEYLRHYEPIAIADYEKIVGIDVERSGLFVHPKYGYLSASPNGLVGDDGIVKIKLFCCTTELEDGMRYRLRLKTNHCYYFEIQGDLEITGREWCDFVVWTLPGYHVERIYRDESFWDEMFPKLERFYKLSLLPELVDSRHERFLPIREPNFVVKANEMRQATAAVPSVEQLSGNYKKSPTYQSDKDAYNFDLDCQTFLRSLQLSPWQINSLQMRTFRPDCSRQIENGLWKEERCKRLTASNFGRVFRLQDKTSRRRLVKELVNDRFSNYATEYGTINEPNAVSAYQKYKQIIVKPCGLFIHPQFGYLGASPDGLVGDDGLVEVKCPSSANRRYLRNVNCGGDWKRLLNNNHDYFYQIQGQLEITGREWCDFVVWTPQGIDHMERIYRDKSVWDKMLPKLERFYKQSLLPEIVDPRIPRGLPIREPDFVLEANDMRGN